MSVMLYRKGTSKRIHGFDVDTRIVDEADVDALLADGWAKTPTAAHETPKPKRRRKVADEG